MILSKVYEDAEHRLERNEITLGEFERLVDIEVIEPKRGEWVDGHGKPMSMTEHSAYCSNCGEWSEYLTSYCGNCGAEMRERESE